MEQKPDPNLKKLGLLTLIVSELLGYSLAGVGLGYLAWSKFKMPWWILLLSSMMGLGLAFYRINELSKKDL
jgi:F0F1-type ATP synthase assembly protein I